MNYCAEIKIALIVVVAGMLSMNVAGQAVMKPESVWQEPWEGVPEHYTRWNYPDFDFPSGLAVWKKDRIQVKETLNKLLGDIPPRPKQLNVRTLSREERDGYILEKFIIDNEVDSWIPGYLAIPAGVKGKVPVIVGLHGHSSSKDNIFGSDSNTAQDVLALLISNGFAVMARQLFQRRKAWSGPRR